MPPELTLGAQPASQDNELTCKRSVLFQCYRNECASNVAAATAKLEEFQATYDSSKAELKSSVSALTVTEKAYKKKASKVGQLQKAVDSAKADFAEFERKDIKQREDLKHAKNKAKKLEKTVTKDTSALSEAASTLAALADDVTRMETEAHTLQAAVVQEESVLDDIYESLKGETADFTKDLEAKQKQLQPLSQARNDALSKAEILRSELDLLTSNARNLQTQLEDSENNLAAVRPLSAPCFSLRKRAKLCSSRIAGWSLHVPALTCHTDTCPRSLATPTSLIHRRSRPLPTALQRSSLSRPAATKQSRSLLLLKRN